MSQVPVPPTIGRTNPELDWGYGLRNTQHIVACWLVTLPIGALVLTAGGCYFEAEAREMVREAEAQRDKEVSALEDARLDIQQEQEAADLSFSHRLERLEVRQSNMLSRHSRERSQESADLSAAQAKDNIILGGLGLFAGAVPGGAGFLAALRKGRKKWQEGQETGRADVAAIFRDAIAEGRSADPNIDKLFDGPLGEILKTRLPEDVQTVVRHQGRHKPAVRASA